MSNAIEARRQAMRAEIDASLPEGADLCGLRELHVYDVFTFWGEPVNPIGLVMGFVVALIAFVMMVTDLFKMPALLAFPITLLIFVGFVKWQSLAASDGLYRKAEKLRREMDMRIAPHSGRVKARTGMPHHSRRVLFVMEDRDYGYEDYAEMKNIQGVGITEALKGRKKGTA